MYETLLWLHSWVRWLVVIGGVAAVGLAWAGWLGRRPFTPRTRAVNLLFIASMDIQFLVGMLLYVGYSPFTKAGFENFGAAMKNPQLRFWLMEHGPSMVIAVVLAHIANARARRAPTDELRHRRFAILATVALVLILMMIPWPGHHTGRPLFR